NEEREERSASLRDIHGRSPVHDIRLSAHVSRSTEHPEIVTWSGRGAPAHDRCAGIAALAGVHDRFRCAAARRVRARPDGGRARYLGTSAGHSGPPGRRGYEPHRVAGAWPARRNGLPVADTRRRWTEPDRERARRGAGRDPDRGTAGGATGGWRAAVLLAGVRLRLLQERGGDLRPLASRDDTWRRSASRQAVQAPRDGRGLLGHPPRRSRAPRGFRDTRS